MINHHTILKEELKRIGNIINKKYATLRKEILKTSEVFDNDQIPVFPYEVCFGLFRQIKDTGSLSSSMAFLPFIHNIINLGFSNIDMSREILTLLTQIKEIPKFQSFDNESKMQQILAVLVSKTSIQLSQMGFTHSLFNVVLSLENSKYKSLWTKSNTILYQTLLLLINDLKDNPTEERSNILFTFLKDLSMITREEKPKWYIENPDQYLILQILSEAFEEKYFTENQNLFIEYFRELMRTIKKEMRKCIENSHILTHSPSKSEINSTGTISSRPWELQNENRLLILVRIGCKINIISKIGFEILEEIIKIISEKKPTIYKAIAYEGLNYLFRNSSWMFKLFESEYTDLFNFLLTTEFNTVKYLFNDYKDKIDLTQYLTGQDTNYNKIMATNTIDINIIEFNYSCEIKMIVKNLEEVTHALYYIYSQRFKIDMNERLQEKVPLEKTYKFCQKTVFETIKAILSKEMSEDTLQSLLKISEKFINISGCFSDFSVCAIYIKLMCKYCLPNEFKNIDHRHIQINKMILNTANCLGHLLTSSCWVIIWKALENYSIYYNRYLLGKEELQSARESDVQILYKSMDSIFAESASYGDAYLLEIIRSLIEVAYECLENNYNDESRKIFAFERIEHIYKLNLARIHLIWPELSSSLLCITTSKVLYFRVSALSLLNTLIPITLNYLKSHPEAIKPPFAVHNYEELVFEPWMNLVSCQFQEIKDELCIAVNKLIIDYGHIMTNGWKCVMEIVKKTSDLKSLQAIVETFLEKVHDYIMDVIISVDEIERHLSDTNQKYLCLTMIWSIADYAKKYNQLNVLKKIYEILLVPEEMFNLGTEARQSSFYIFAEIVVHNCNEKEEKFWIWIFDEIKNFYGYGIKECIGAKNKSFGEEALKNLITNLIKIYKKFFKVSNEWPSTCETPVKLLADFYTFCSSVLQFRSPEIYQSLLKQTKEILLFKTKESIAIKEFYIFLESLTQIYYVENDSKILKSLITYLPSDIFELLGISLGGLKDNFIIMYRLTEKIFLLRLEALEKDIKLPQMRIFFEEKHHYEFLKKMQNFIIDEGSAIVELYIESVCKTLQRLKLYEDYHSISKTLPFLIAINMKYPLVLSVRVLETLKEIINCRYDDNWIKQSANIKDIPIWHICIQDLMKLCYEFLNIGSNYDISYKTLKEVLFNENKEKINKFPKEIEYHYYQCELEICNFLFENYYYGINIQIDKEEEDVKQVVGLLEKRSLEIIDLDLGKRWENAYQLLFKLCSVREENKYADSKIETNQSIVIERVLFRVIKTLQKIKSGKNGNSEIEELKFVLKKLLNLKLKEKTFQKIENSLQTFVPQNIKINTKVLELPEAHLFYLQPFINKCIQCEDKESLELIENIFEKCSYIVLNL